jgi:hypothetical protein
MEQDPLKAAWQNIATGQKSNGELSGMIKERLHPVLKRIRIQLVLEMFSFIVFLIVYYDFFDGNKKPVYANVCLVSALVLVILHNLIGYFLIKHPFKENNIKQSLQQRLAKIKKYAATAIAVRFLMVVCLLIFFTSTIKFNENKYWLLIGLVIILLIEMLLLSLLWKKRIKRIKASISLFS